MEPTRTILLLSIVLSLFLPGGTTDTGTLLFGTALLLSYLFYSVDDCLASLGSWIDIGDAFSHSY